MFMKFEFDPAKAASNLKKHRISFSDAQAVFYDDRALTMEDPDSQGEQCSVHGVWRASQLTHSGGLRLGLVCGGSGSTPM